MVRAPRYGYRQGYASWQRQPLWQEGERIDKWNPYYRQDLTGADDEISLEDVEGGKPPTYVPQIDRQALGYKDVLGPRNHPWQALSETLPPAAGYGDIYDQMGETNRRNRGLGGLIRRVNPFDNVQPPAAAGPPQPFEGNLPRPRPQTLDAFSSPPASIQRMPMDDYFGNRPPGVTLPPEIERGLSPGSTSWNEEPQETIGTHGGFTDLIAPPDKPQQDTQNVAAIFGSPQSGATAMAEDPRGNTSRRRYEAARIAREAFERDPSLVKEFLPKLRDAGVDPSLGAPEGWSLPEAPETWPKTPGFGTETEAERAARRAEQEAAYRRDIFPPGTGIPGPAVPGGPRPGEPLIMPPAQQNTQSVADIFSGGGAAGPAPYAPLIAGRPAGLGPVTGLSQMTPNIPAAAPPRPYMGPAPRDPLPRQTAALGSGERLPTPGMPRPRPEEFGPYEGIPGQVADLRNGPRDITRGLIAGGQEARLPIARPPGGMAFAGNLPQPRPDMPGDVAALSPDQRIAPFVGPAPPVSPELAAGAARATRPTDPFLTGLPAQGAIGQTAVGQAPYDPLSSVRPPLIQQMISERIGTIPPAETNPAFPAMGSDLIAGPAAPTARLPRPRPPDEAMGSDVPGPQSGLPPGTQEFTSTYDPPQPQRKTTPTDIAVARQAIIDAAGQPDELIAPPANVAPIEPVTLGASAPETASMSAEWNPTTKSRRTGFLGNLFDREHFVGGPGLTASPSTVGTDYTKSAKPGRGKYKPAEHERLARNLGKTAGLAASVVGVPPIVAVPAFGSAGAMINRAIDPNRQVIERGPLTTLANILGIGRRLRDKDKDKDTIGTPPKKDPSTTSLPGSAYGGRYVGGTYTGQSTGGRYITEGTGGAFR